MVDVYDERDELSRKLNYLEEKINNIEEWLIKNGWAENHTLPDFMAANFKCKTNRDSLDEGESLADMVYELIKITKE